MQACRTVDWLTAFKIDRDYLVLPYWGMTGSVTALSLAPGLPVRPRLRSGLTGFRHRLEGENGKPTAIGVGFWHQLRPVQFLPCR
jgi:hypothetical protein